MFSTSLSWLCLVAVSVGNKRHVRSNGHEDSVQYYRVQEGYCPGPWANSRYWRARRTHSSGILFASWGHGAFDWTPGIVPLPVLEFSVERGCLTSSLRPERITGCIRFAVDGGFSGSEYYRADNLARPVSLVGHLEKTESCKVRRNVFLIPRDLHPPPANVPVAILEDVQRQAFRPPKGSRVVFSQPGSTPLRSAM